ncbi:MAG: peptidylprolyl isomerase [Desulfomonilaceae bacterium]|nr:peptidylprolyl isomerase [Desulfomonilaceae bacterium]
MTKSVTLRSAFRFCMCKTTTRLPLDRWYANATIVEGDRNSAPRPGAMKTSPSFTEMTTLSDTHDNRGRGGLLIVGLLTFLACTTLAVTSARAQVYTDRIVAVVNGDVILESDVERHKKPLIRSLTNLNLGVVPPGKWPTERDFLDELIVLTLLEQEASKKGINPDKKSVDASIEMVRDRNKLTQEQFVLFLAANGLNYANFRDLFRRKIKLEGLIASEVTKKVPFSEEDAQLYFKTHGAEEVENQYKDLIKEMAPPEPPQKKFEPNVPTHEEVFHGGTVRLRMLTINLPKGNNRAAVAKAENTAKRISEELMTGADFGALAKKYSQDPLKDKGGDLGYMAYKDMRPEWQRMVRRMKKGQVLGPIKSRDAILMFYLDDAKGRKVERVPIPENIRKKLISEQKKMYEEQMEARRKHQEPSPPPKESPPEPRGASSAQPAAPEKKDASDVLSAEELEGYKKVRNMVLAIVRTEKIQARMKEWIEDLKKSSIIDVKL